MTVLSLCVIIFTVAVIAQCIVFISTGSSAMTTRVALVAWGDRYEAWRGHAGFADELCKHQPAVTVRRGMGGTCNVCSEIALAVFLNPLLTSSSRSRVVHNFAQSMFVLMCHDFVPELNLQVFKVVPTVS